MQKISKLLALILAVAMLATLMVACGDKKSDDKSDNSASETDAPAVAGAEQTWGEITVFVPDTMKMTGGNGAYDPDDQKTLWLHSNEAGTKYIEVTIVDSEDNAKTNLEGTKTMSKEYSPVDLSYVSPATNQTWNGVEYDALGYHCVSVYTVAGDKVYYIMSAGYTIDSGELPAVLDSLK